jgi:hypothetical protein
MKIVVVYIYPLNGDGVHGQRAMRFVDSYHRNPPGVAHSTIVICNGGNVFGPHNLMFAGVLNTEFVHHNDIGMDIGGFVIAARRTDADLMVFCGGNTYFRKPGWLGRCRDSFAKHGDTLYGSSGNQGIGDVHPHIRTTGFWCRPGLLLEYCPDIISNERRYEFEHGRTCFSNWVKMRGKIPYVVTWQGEYPLHACDAAPGGYHNGTQHNLLMGDRLTQPPYHHCD